MVKRKRDKEIAKMQKKYEKIRALEEIENLPIEERLKSLKLKEEIYLLRKPIYRKVGFYVAIAPMFLGVIAFVSAWMGGYFDTQNKIFENERTLLEIKKAELKEETKELSDKYANLGEEYEEKEKRLIAELKAATKELSDKYVNLGEEYREKEKKLKAELKAATKELSDKYVNLGEEYEEKEKRLIAELKAATKNLVIEKQILSDINANLEVEYKEKNRKLEKHKEEILTLQTKLKEREKEQDKLIALRGKKVLVNKEETQTLLVLGESVLGKAIDSSKQLQDTVGVLKQYAETLPKVKTPDVYSFDDWYYKGAGEFLNKKYPEAIDSFKKALPNAPDDASAAYTHNYIGAAYANIGIDKEAFKNFIKAIEFKPNNPLSHLNKARIHINSGEIQVAEDEIEMVKDLFKEGKVNEGEKAFIEKEIELVEEAGFTAESKEEIQYGAKLELESGEKEAKAEEKE
jgi:Flp pilus assembly protein TadD